MLPNLPLCPDISVQQSTDDATIIVCGTRPVLRLSHQPVAFHLLNEQGDVVVSANARNKMYFEQLQIDDDAKVVVADDGEKEDTRTIIDWGEVW